MNLVETDRLVGGYGKTLVLREVSLQVPKGSIYGFLGPNGAGKTTALRMLLGLLRPRTGSIRLFGECLKTTLPGILSRVGSLIEQPSLYGHLSGTANLEIARRLKGLDRAAVESAVRAVDIGSYIARKTSEYSRGMKQRLGVAMAALGNPELLILDEPTNGMDARGLETFSRLLQSLNKEAGTTILLSSHQFKEVERVATHVGILSEVGDLLYQGTRQELAVRVPQRLVIKANEPEQARCILTTHNYVVDSRQETLIINHATAEMAHEANWLLVTNGVKVHHLEIETATLEALFSRVLRTVKPWGAA